MNELARKVAFSEDTVHVLLAGGREIPAPLQWFPRLSHVTPEQSADWKLIGDGIGIHWPQVDEDIEVERLLAT